MKCTNHHPDEGHIMRSIISRRHNRFYKFVREMTMKFSKSAMFAHTLVLLVSLSVGLNGCGGGGSDQSNGNNSASNSSGNNENTNQATNLKPSMPEASLSYSGGIYDYGVPSWGGNGISIVSTNQKYAKINFRTYLDSLNSWDVTNASSLGIYSHIIIRYENKDICSNPSAISFYLTMRFQEEFKIEEGRTYTLNEIPQVDMVLHAPGRSAYVSAYNSDYCTHVYEYSHSEPNTNLTSLSPLGYYFANKGGTVGMDTYNTFINDISGTGLSEHYLAIESLTFTVNSASDNGTWWRLAPSFTYNYGNDDWADINFEISFRDHNNNLRTVSGNMISEAEVLISQQESLNMSPGYYNRTDVEGTVLKIDGANSYSCSWAACPNGITCGVQMNGEWDSATQKLTMQVPDNGGQTNSYVFDSVFRPAGIDLYSFGSRTGQYRKVGTFEEATALDPGYCTYIE